MNWKSIKCTFFALDEELGKLGNEKWAIFSVVPLDRNDADDVLVIANKK